jgi:hypothetical protein
MKVAVVAFLVMPAGAVDWPIIISMVLSPPEPARVLMLLDGVF